MKKWLWMWFRNDGIDATHSGIVGTKSPPPPRPRGDGGVQVQSGAAMVPGKWQVLLHSELGLDMGAAWARWETHVPT